MPDSSKLLFASSEQRILENVVTRTRVQSARLSRVMNTYGTADVHNLKLYLECPNSSSKPQRRTFHRLPFRKVHFPQVCHRPLSPCYDWQNERPQGDLFCFLPLETSQKYSTKKSVGHHETYSTQRRRHSRMPPAPFLLNGVAIQESLQRASCLEAHLFRSVYLG